MESTITLHPYVQLALDTLAPILITVLGGVVTMIAAKANAWMRSKVHSASFACASEKLDKLTEDAVREASRTLAAGYKAAAEDGKLTKAEGEHVREQVVGVVKRHLGERGIEELKECLGDLDASVIEGMIRTRIEAMLDRLAPPDAGFPMVEPAHPAEDSSSAPTSLSPDGPARV